MLTNADFVAVAKAGGLTDAQIKALTVPQRIELLQATALAKLSDPITVDATLKDAAA
jgi:hypothetical protein